MAGSPAVSSANDEIGTVLDGAYRLVIVAAALLGLLLVVDAVQPPTDELAGYLYPEATTAPPIVLTDPNGRSFSLASLRGEPVLVFFGYTHCPDVCPTTIGRVGRAMEAYGPAVRAVFVTVDPERDTTTWLRDYARYLPAGFVPLTGTSAEVRAVADAWAVRYAMVAAGAADEYAMSHTADVYVVDAAGLLRAHLPFGTESETMSAVLRRVAATSAQETPTIPSAGPTAAMNTGPSVEPVPSAYPAPSAVPTTGLLGVEIRSSSVWAGGASPVILALEWTVSAWTTKRPW